ncbi:MAG: TIGR03435 family protein [Terriglobia bacterium]
MIPNYLSAIWGATAPALGNHLWQSTLCIVVAGLLALILRKDHARARYGLWLAASVKFLIPFSLLIVIGSHLGRPRALPQTQPGFFFAMEKVSQPFTKAATGSQAAEKSRRPAQDAGLRYRLVHLLPAVLVAMWLCGFVFVFFLWWIRWRRISATVREAAPLREGREVEALRRLERRGGIRRPIELLLSAASLEPGIFGIVKPVLVWPKGISEHLGDAHLDAILAHEVWHVRRRDNLAAAIHMVVEAIFWFHPLVWWVGVRLLEERERACDEEVLESGGERQVYAESILKTCEFCVESPLAYVSGVTGADLKKRIIRVMTEGMANKLSFGRKVLLAAIGIAAIAGPVVFGLMNAPQVRGQSAQITEARLPSFEVASVKPSEMRHGGAIGVFTWPGGRVTAGLFPPKYLLMVAFDVEDCQVVGAPSWTNEERYDIIAIPPASSPASKLNPSNPKLPPNAEQRQMLQKLLMDRFQLKYHRESKPGPIYVLVKGNRDLKLHDAKDKDAYPWAGGLPGGAFNGAGMAGMNITMPQLAARLSEPLKRPVVDQTSLNGSYDFKYEYATDDPAPDVVSCIFASVQGIGLKLKSANGPVEIIVIDHVERPSEN